MNDGRLKERLAKLERKNRLLQESLHQAGRLSRLRDKALRDLKSAEAKLKLSEEKFLKIATAARDGIIMLNESERIVFWNRAATDILGFEESEVQGRKLTDLVVPESQRDHVHASYLEFAETGFGKTIGYTVERETLTKSGRSICLELSVTAFELRGNWQAVGIFRDITQRKKSEQELKYVALRDPLTGAYNRRGFSEKLAEDLKRSTRYEHPLSVLLVDLDHFKSINDSYGHGAGDKLLQHLVRVIENSIRDLDYIGRYGGDEMVVTLVETSKASALLIGERIRIAVENERLQLKEGTKVGITISVGVATCPDDARTTDDLIAVADDALYRAKSIGRNKVYTKGVG